MEHIKKMFEDSVNRYGSTEWKGVKLALTQDPYPTGPVDWFFIASAMDLYGNLWEIIWHPKPNADEYDDYADQVDDWDKPDFAEIVDPGYYLD